jgi:hypothetical protein
MSRNGDEDDATLWFDNKFNTNNSEESSKTRASTDAKLKDLTKRLEKLMAENNKLRRKVKAKRTKGVSSPSEEEYSSYEEEEEDSEREYDEDEMALFINKRRPYKGERKEKPMSKRVCYNYSKNGHFIAQCLYERKKEDNDKRKKFDKCYKKDKKYTKKKPYGQAHVDQEWNSSDESSESKSDEVATIAIRGKTSSSRSLFPNLSKHTCLMAKEGKKMQNPLPLPLPSMSLVIKILFLVIIMILVMMITLFQVNL